MRPLLIAMSGLGFAVIMFVSGLIAATAFFKAEPERQLSLATDTTGVWTDHPVKVNPTAQEFDRLAARPTPKQASRTVASGSPAEVTISEKAREGEADSQIQPDMQAETIAAHVAWCSDRYRSYRSSDNSYTPYSGGRRECVSPYFGASDTAQAYDPDETEYRPFEGRVDLIYAATERYVGTDHTQYCFSRYRSYRPEDNTYQPYDGGPRRQCQ
jgi:hypothetical protein